MKLDTLNTIVRSLNEAGCRYLVAGGMAVVAHGYGRMTNDLDIVVQLESDNVVRGLKALEQLGYRSRLPVTPEQFADAKLRESWIRDKGMVVLDLFSDNTPDTPIDVFVEEPFEFDAAWERALVEELDDGLACRFVDIDTLIAMKEQAGRVKDRDDVEHLRLLAGDGPQ